MSELIRSVTELAAIVAQLDPATAGIDIAGAITARTYDGRQFEIPQRVWSRPQAPPRMQLIVEGAR
jgi:hypothetical protein